LTIAFLLILSLLRGFRASSPKTVTLELQKVRPWMKPRPETMDATFTITIE
jgi:hypothetical protein